MIEPDKELLIVPTCEDTEINIFEDEEEVTSGDTHFNWTKTTQYWKMKIIIVLILVLLLILMMALQPVYHLPQMKCENTQQTSILFAKKFSLIWNFCNQSTLHCSACPTGWTEYMSRCFFLSSDKKKWLEARRECLGMGADLAVIQNPEDQVFLTHMAFDFKRQHPQEIFLSAWIGLHDMEEDGSFAWVTGDSVNDTYWMNMEPNNAIAKWDKSKAGQDCVAIVPPAELEVKNWLNTWDDITCRGTRHYLCETTALNLF